MARAIARDPTPRVQPIERLDDPRLAPYRNVRDAELRDRQGLFIAEGRLNVLRLLDCERYRTRSLLVTEAALRGIGPALAQRRGDVPVYLASPRLLREVAGYPVHRGCLAAAERAPEPALGELLGPRCGEPRLVLVLEDVTNPDNVGGLFRNAVAFAADAVVLSARCADPLYRKSLRVSMGGSLRVPFARVADLAGALAQMRDAGLALAALCPARDATPLAAWRPPRRLALLVGAEDRGLSPPVRARADVALGIPMAPGVDSLNVATAAGVALHHVFAARCEG